MQIREECINTWNELRPHLNWKRFTEAIKKEGRIEYSKKL